MALNSMDELLELMMSERADVRAQSFVTLSQLSGTVAGADMISKCKAVVSVIVGSIVTTQVSSTEPLLTTNFTTLTNISVCVEGAKAVLAHHKILLPVLLQVICDPLCTHADAGCGLLSNLTRVSEHCQQFLEHITEDSAALPRLLAVATSTAHNKKGCSLHLLMAVMENVSQLPQGRRLMLDTERQMVQRVLPFIGYSPSAERRRATVALLHNCCFNKEDHTWLLSPSVDLANHLCLPLCGPDTFSEEESNELSVLLVYQPDDKQREPNKQIRLLLLNSLTLLCATRPAREELRRQNVYYTLRELHKWEEDHNCLVVLEDLVNVLIRTEEEIDVDDITSLEVPEHLQKKFIELDKPTEEAQTPAAVVA